MKHTLRSRIQMIVKKWRDVDMMSFDDIAVKVGMSKASAHHIYKGVRTVSIDVAQRIFDIADTEVESGTKNTKKVCL